ncbi:MAG: hypothetical protein ACLFQ8_00950 [Candidatus Aenigmatarchaeota archaeon]
MITESCYDVIKLSCRTGLGLLYLERMLQEGYEEEFKNKIASSLEEAEKMLESEIEHPHYNPSVSGNCSAAKLLSEFLDDDVEPSDLIGSCETVAEEAKNLTAEDYRTEDIHSIKEDLEEVHEKIIEASKNSRIKF